MGFAAGANVGIALTAIEPNVRTAVFSSPGGLTSSEQPRLSPLTRAGVGGDLVARVPSLLNPAGAPLVASVGGIPVGPPLFDIILFARGDQNFLNPSTSALLRRGEAAVFFATDGAETIDPDGAGPLFEVPIEGSLPEDFGYIP